MNRIRNLFGKNSEPTPTIIDANSQPDITEESELSNQHASEFNQRLRLKPIIEEPQFDTLEQSSSQSPPSSAASTSTPPEPVKGAGKVKCVRKEDDGTLKIVKCNTLTDIEERDEVTNAKAELAKAETAHETATTELSNANAKLTTAKENTNLPKSRIGKITSAVLKGSDETRTAKIDVNEKKALVKTAKDKLDIATENLKAAEKRLKTAQTNLEKKQKILKDPIKWCFGKSMRGGGKPVSRKHRTRTFSKSRKLRGRRSVGKSSSRKIRK